MVVFVVSCSKSEKPVKPVEPPKPKVKDAQYLELLGDKELKEDKEAESDDSNNYVYYEGEKGYYMFNKNSAKLISITRKDDIKPEELGNQKSKEELLKIADDALAKIDSEFTKKDIIKTVEDSREEEGDAVQTSFIVMYKEKSENDSNSNKRTIELDSSGNFLSYTEDSFVIDGLDDTKVKITDKQAIDIAKKDLFKHFEIDQKYFEEKNGTSQAQIVSLDGKNVWFVNLEYEDGTIRGGDYYIDLNSPNIIKSEQFK